MATRYTGQIPGTITSQEVMVHGVRMPVYFIFLMLKMALKFWKRPSKCLSRFSKCHWLLQCNFLLKCCGSVWVSLADSPKTTVKLFMILTQKDFKNQFLCFVCSETKIIF